MRRLQQFKALQEQEFIGLWWAKLVSLAPPYEMSWKLTHLVTKVKGIRHRIHVTAARERLHMYREPEHEVDRVIRLLFFLVANHF
jgi:hypothetical protein